MGRVRRDSVITGKHLERWFGRLLGCRRAGWSRIDGNNGRRRL